MTRKRPADERSEGESDQNKTEFENGIHILISFDGVDKLCRDERNDTLDDDFERYEYRRQDGLSRISLDALCKPF